MPVRDRSNRRLVRQGVIRLGHKETRRRKDGSEYSFPVQDDHFLLHDAPEIEQFYHKRGIKEVRELDVLLPFPDIERNFPTWYQVWAGGVLVCQGDGEYVAHAAPFTCSISARSKRASVKNAPGDTLVANGVAQVAFDWNGAHFEAGEHVPCPGAKQDAYPHCAACKLSSVLKIMMADPELFRFGYYQISTGSGRNYDTIMGTLEAMPADRVNGVPFKLRMVQESTSFQDADGTRKKTTKGFLQLEPDPEITRQLYSRQVSQMIAAPAPRLPAETPERSGLEWDIIDAEPPAPPPYAEDQVPYEDEQSTGDPFLNGDHHGAPMDADAREDLREEQERNRPRDLGFVPDMSDWDGTHWGELRQLAADHLGYAHAAHAKNTLKTVFAGASPADITYQAAWSELVNHQRSKSENA